MWVYRITEEYGNTEFTRPLDQVSRIMEHATHKSEFPLDNVHTFRHDWEEAQKLWRQIKWDGTISGQPRVFLTPGASGYMIGFHVVTTDRRSFIASPIPLPHLQDTLDWDAYTDSEEVPRARTLVLTGEEGMPAPSRVTIKWSRSRKGNLTAFHENSNITVFPTDTGFKAVVSFGNHLKTFTPVKKTEAEACRYVIENYEHLKRELVSEPISANDPWADDN